MSEHPDPEVAAALVALCDRLCQWERATGRRSVFILREEGGYAFRVCDGKPGIPEDIADFHLLQSVGTHTGALGLMGFSCGYSECAAFCALKDPAAAKAAGWSEYPSGTWFCPACSRLRIALGFPGEVKP